MIWKIQVSAWKTVEAVSRLVQRNTSSRMMLVAMIVCPATTATNETIRMTSMARRESVCFDLIRAGEQRRNGHTANLILNLDVPAE